MKILLVDGHIIWGDSNRLLFGANHHVTTANNHSDAYTQLTQERPDIVVLDQTFPEIDRTTLLKRIRALPDPPPVLMLTDSDDPQLIASAQASGTTDNSHTPPLTRTPDEAVIVEAAFQSATAASAPQSGRQTLNKRMPKNLRITEREIDVLALMVSGLPNKSIANQLGISESTVKSHLKSLYQTLEVNNRVSCHNKARQLGLVPDNIIC